MRSFRSPGVLPILFPAPGIPSPFPLSGELSYVIETSPKTPPLKCFSVFLSPLSLIPSSSVALGRLFPRCDYYSCSSLVLPGLKVPLGEGSRPIPSVPPTPSAKTGAYKALVKGSVNIRVNRSSHIQARDTENSHDDETITQYLKEKDRTEFTAYCSEGRPCWRGSLFAHSRWP